MRSQLQSKSNKNMHPFCLDCLHVYINFFICVSESLNMYLRLCVYVEELDLSISAVNKSPQLVIVNTFIFLSIYILLATICH